MKYYLVAVASARYHGRDPLTYSFESELPDGAIVTVPLQRQSVLGFVLRRIEKPSFATKPVTKHHEHAGRVPAALSATLSWMQSYYPSPLGITTQLFLPKTLPERVRASKPPRALTIDTSLLPPLTEEQANAIEHMQAPGTYLLHGETGSGKTRLYSELARHALENGTSSIILTPEISLTSQLAQNMARIIPANRLFVLHSQLTEAARRTIWLALQSSTEPVVVIGPRSALFSPIHSLGLIVLDESHEPAYKQENAPHYHAARVGAFLAQQHGAKLVLGSATPPVTDYYMAQQKRRPIIRLTTQAIVDTNTTKVETITIDMRDTSQHSSAHPLSTELVNRMHAKLQEKQQTLLFLNRRGTARIVLCESCGWQSLCPHCDIPLTYHHDHHQFQCHTCGYHEPAKTSCPECSNSDIRLKSVGTKAIMIAVQKKFPTARIARFDADNLTGERLHEVYEQIHRGEIDILIGTQTLAKGLDLPRLGLVGILNADASLYIPDFTAQERTYQLLYQLIGRVGRGHQAGTVIVQTYSPNNITIQAATNKDWDSFYSAELAERKEFLFPPFCHLLKLSCRRATSLSAQSSAEKVAEQLKISFPRVIIDGPAPSFHEKVQGKYAWQLIIKSKDRQQLLDIIDRIPRDWYFDIDPVDLL